MQLFRQCAATPPAARPAGRSGVAMTMTRLRLSCSCWRSFSADPMLGAQSKLEIYWIDVEGGAATFGVAVRRTTLIDRLRAQRPRPADSRTTRHVKKIDNVVISHFHGDVGGLRACQADPDRTFHDHGDRPRPTRWDSTTTSPSTAEAEYRQARRHHSDEGSKRSSSPRTTSSSTSRSRAAGPTRLRHRAADGPVRPGQMGIAVPLRSASSSSSIRSTWTGTPIWSSSVR